MFGEGRVAKEYRWGGRRKTLFPETFLSSPNQGSFLIYPESEAVSFSEPQISRGVPQNRPIKLLVRVYVVKVSIRRPSMPPVPVKVMYMKATD